MVQEKVRNGVMIAAIILLTACGGERNAESTTPAAAASVENLGQISAMINGETRTWYVTATKAGEVWRSQSDWSALGGAQVGSVNIFGLVDVTRSVGSNGALTIGFTLAKTEVGHQASSAEISLHPENPGLGNHSSSNDGAAEIMVTNAVQSGDMLRLKGTFTATLPFRKFSSRDADMADVIKVENGKFDVAIPPLQK